MPPSNSTTNKINKKWSAVRSQPKTSLSTKCVVIELTATQDIGILSQYNKELNSKKQKYSKKYQARRFGYKSELS